MKTKKLNLNHLQKIEGGLRETPGIHEYYCDRTLYKYKGNLFSGFVVVVVAYVIGCEDYL